MNCQTCRGVITNGNCGCSTGQQGASLINVGDMIAALRARAEHLDRLVATYRASNGVLLTDKAALQRAAEKHATALAAANARAEKADEEMALRVQIEREREAACKERDAALAACAELRAGIVHVVQHQANHRIPMPMAYIDDLLSRPDLGAGVVVVPREVVERVRQIIQDDGYDADADIIADLDALLKKGGG